MKELTLDLGDFGEKIRFAMVDPNSLKIDHSYQRDETDLVEHIGSHFNPLAYICCVVAERGDGSRYLIDGQQRTKGAIRAGKKVVPAMIFRSTGKEAEAKLFRYLNEFRKPVTVIDIFRASLVAGEEDVVAINKAVNEAGFKIALKKGLHNKWPYISAIEQVQLIYRKDGAEVLCEVLQWIEKLWKNEPEALRREAIRGFYAFYRAFGITIDEQRMKERFKGNPMASILNQAATEKAREKNRGNTTPLYQCIFGVLRKIYGKTVPPVDKAWPRTIVE